MATTYLAIDLGAESGRVMRGALDGGRLRLEEIHRFPNGPIRVFDSLHWDILRLFAEIKEGLKRCAGDPAAPRSLGVDTWGVDVALLGRDRVLLGNPHNYRDPRTDGMTDAVFRIVPRREVFEQTGVQVMQINTLYQLYAMRLARSPLLDAADRLLLMGDLFHFLLTGEAVAELTNASTSQFYNPRSKAWATPLLERLGIPIRLLPPIVPPGARIGPLLPSIRQETGLGAVEVIAPGTHDTASAIAAVPVEPGASHAYISSGTWSLVGVESPEPVITDASYANNFTNEVGVGCITLLKNVMGLWLVQESCRAWAAAGTPTPYDQVGPLALKAPAFRSLVDPDDPRFLKPGDMPAKIQAYCRETNQPVPEGRESILRCILESLTLKYRWVLTALEAMRGRRIDVLHIVGGGSKNELLDQFAADALGRPVIAGPVEATAIGNVLTQAVACGDVASQADARRIVRESYEVKTFAPRDRGPWDEAYGRFAPRFDKPAG
jgi:rhamnulokinase